MRCRVRRAPLYWLAGHSEGPARFGPGGLLCTTRPARWDLSDSANSQLAPASRSQVTWCSSMAIPTTNESPSLLCGARRRQCCSFLLSFGCSSKQAAQNERETSRPRKRETGTPLPTLFPTMSQSELLSVERMRSMHVLRSRRSAGLWYRDFNFV